jgi:putative sterol carrier protein
VSAADPKAFYTETLPAQWNRVLGEQERAAEEAKRVLDGMRAVDATLRIEVRGPGGGVFFLNIERGVASAGEAPSHPPLLTLVQDRPAFDLLVAEAGNSALGFLGGLSGLAGEMKLTAARVESLRAISGAMRFEIVGDGGFSLITHFGSGPLPEKPDTEIRVEREAYEALRRGELNPQDAFLGGRIRVEGDMQLAMQIALVAMSPD